MYLAFAPRSKADVGTIVEESEKIVKITNEDSCAFTLNLLVTWAPMYRIGQVTDFTKKELNPLEKPAPLVVIL